MVQQPRSNFFIKTQIFNYLDQGGNFLLKVNQIQLSSEQSTYRLAIQFYNPKFIDQKIVQAYFDFTDSQIGISSNSTLFYSKYNEMKLVGQPENLSIHFTIQLLDLNQITLMFPDIQRSVYFTIKLSSILQDSSIINQKFNAMLFKTIAPAIFFMAFFKLGQSIEQSPQESGKISIEGLIIMQGYDVFQLFYFANSVLNYNIFDFMPCIMYSTVFLMGFKIILALWIYRNSGVFNNDQEFRRQLIIYILKLYLVVFAIVFLLFFFFINFFVYYILFMFLVPQIVRTSIIGQTLQLKYIIMFAGLTIPKLFFITYLRACPENIYQISPNYEFSIIIACQVISQLVFMTLQRLLGPRFFIHRFFLPKQFVYYKKIKHNSINTDLLQDVCSICMETIYKDQEKDLIEKTDKKIIKYMQTPCRHNFHVNCLKNWMEIKLECPTCRTQIPPFEG